MTARVVEHTDGRWEVSGVASEPANAYLKRFAPWRMQLAFDSGPKASDFETYAPFNEFPLRKLQVVLDSVTLPKAPAVLDIGFNCGYNSLYASSRLGGAVTGIDVVQKHKDVAEGLAGLVGLGAEFLLESAEEFERPETYDLILHFGTLYHLPNPLRSIEKTARSTKKGGWFALETVRYLGDPGLAKWVWGFNNDKTNFWALGDRIIDDFFVQSGLSKPKLIFNANVAVYKGEMSRAIWIAQKV